MENKFAVRKIAPTDYILPIREKNRKINMACNWLFLESKKQCEKGCRGEFCFRHKKRACPKPCKDCGNDTRKIYAKAVETCVNG